MAEEIKAPTGFADPAKNNAEVAQKLAAQDIMATPTNASDITGDSGDALDNLAAQVTEKVEPAPAVTPVQTPEEKSAAEKLAADAAAKAAADAEHAKRADVLFKDAPQLAPN